MALNPVNPIQSGSATATNGSPTITVTGGVDCSFIVPGFILQLGTRRIVSAISGTAPVSGVSTITLAANWDQPTTTDVLIGWNSYESLPNIVNRIQNALGQQTAIGELTTNGLIEKTGTNAYQTVTITAFGKSLIDDADAATARTTLGAQAADATLTAMAGVTTAANKIIYFTGVDAAAAADLSAYGRTLIATADAAAARNLLGVGTAAQSAELQSVIYSDFRSNEHRIWEQYGLTPKQLTDIWTTTRAGDATYNSPTGIKTASANTARIEYDTATGEARGLLCESARTNLLLWSEDLTNAAWVKSSITVTSDAQTAPDGTMTADRLTKTATSFASVRQAIASTALSTYNVSFYAKAVGPDDIVSVAVTDSLSNNISRAYVNLSTGAVTNSVGTGNPTAIRDKDGWWRVSISAVAADSSTRCFIYPALFSEAVARSVDIWGAQIELGVDPTSYIPTTTAQATRPVSQHARTITDLFNKAGSTIIIDFRSDIAANSFVNGLFGAGPNSTSQALTMSYLLNSGTGAVRCRWYAGGAQIELTSAASSAPRTQMNRAVISFNSAGAFALAVNGVDVGTATCDNPDTASWTQYWLGALRTKTDSPIARATIAQMLVIPRWISSASERAEISKR